MISGGASFFSDGVHSLPDRPTLRELATFWCEFDYGSEQLAKVGVFERFTFQEYGRRSICAEDYVRMRKLATFLVELISTLPGDSLEVYLHI